MVDEPTIFLYLNLVYQTIILTFADSIKPGFNLNRFRPKTRCGNLYLKVFSHENNSLLHITLSLLHITLSLLRNTILKTLFFMHCKLHF
ncbi:hypothetical protein HanRHA438_Chr02g0067321 [Helianthus annuus]|uniref:Uncharacterized protein n=1 Tax=Helianthus annuus TaxID=4232 RepID=A0A9K3JP02_HELAN|nr:hypothetical protein HanXRQr2_Chr02g0066091 [Helianthus annuus]KAJ0615389.1 hypothetical protein HanIR_Chr02g0073531 [Helianthus annuus]KAJ0939966.1 hypothetical protein HanRHA438_Chr02g0067321 [Helianthus annuus]